MAIAGTNRLLGSLYIPFGETSADTLNTGLTLSDTEPLPPGYSNHIERPAWWRFKSDTTQWVQIDTELSTSTDYADTVIAIWWRNPSTNAYDLIASDDDSGSEIYQSTSKVVFRAGAGATYYVQVLSWTSTGNTTYRLRTGVGTPVSPGFTYDSTLPTAPAGADNFSSAVEFALGATPTNFSSTGLGVEAGEPDLFSSFYAETRSCWWTFTPNTSGLVKFAWSPGHLALFSGTSLANLELVENEYMEFSMYAMVTAGTKYYLRWANGQSNGGLTSTTSVTVNTSTVLPVTETKVPFTNVRSPLNGAGYTTTLTGGSGALADNSDSTYLTVARPNQGYAANNIARADFAASPADTFLVKSYFRASTNTAPIMGEEGPCLYYYNGLNTIYTRGSRQWRWKPTELRMRTGWTSLLPVRLVTGGSTDATTGGWANQNVPYAGLSYWGPISGPLTATIAEAGWLAYTYDASQAPTQPPDVEEVIAGQIDGTRVRPYIRGR